MSRVEPATPQYALQDGVLTLRGRLGLAEAAGLIEALQDSIDSIRRIDLAELEDIDSAGVASLRLLQRRGPSGERRIEFGSLPPRYRAICEAHRIDPRGAGQKE
jgi:ABC-type transporter Mla MlaB component